MEAYDFEYDGISLNDMGYILCQFDSGGLQTLSNGSRISLQTVSTLRGARHELTSSAYEECLSTTLQICKNPYIHENMEISTEELRELMRWLNRKNFHKFKLLDDEYMDLYFEASFNISRIEINGKLSGLELEMTTNRPFALQEPRYIMIQATDTKKSAIIYDTSDEEGYIYPYTEITVKKEGALELCNKFEQRNTIITNCKKGEIITLDYPIIKSSLESHKIEQDFNWNFFRIVNTCDSRKNELTISLPCDIKIRYSPIVKVGI